MIGALFITAKLACIYLSSGNILPEPRIYYAAGVVPTPAAYRIVKRPHPVVLA